MGLKKINQKIINTFTNIFRPKENTEFIQNISNLTGNISNEAKNLKSIDKLNITNIKNYIDEFISYMKSFRNVKLRNTKDTKNISYTTIGDIIKTLESNLCNSPKNSSDPYAKYTQLVFFHKSVTELYQCKEIFKYNSMYVKEMQEKIKKLQETVASLMNKIYSLETKQKNVELKNISDKLKPIIDKLKTETNNLNIKLDDDIDNFKNKLKSLVSNLEVISEPFTGDSKKIFLTLKDNINKLINKIKFGTDCPEFDYTIQTIKIILNSIPGIDIPDAHKTVIKEYLSKLKEQLELSKNNFNLKNQQIYFEKNINNFINNLNKTDFYNKICDNNYKKSENMTNNKFIEDVKNKNKQLIDTINKFTNITQEKLWPNFTSILTELKKLLEFKIEKELPTKSPLSKFQNLVLLSQFPKFIQDTTKSNIQTCFKELCDSYGKLLQKVNIIFAIPESTEVQRDIKAKLRDLWVVDQNKTGNYVTNSGNLSTSELKELFEKRDNSNFLKKHSRTYGPQNALEIANGNQMMNIQVKRRSGTFSRTSNYVLIKSDGKTQYGNIYPGETDNRINNNNNNKEAVQEVTNYLKNVLYYGRFEDNKLWLSSSPDLTKK